MAFAQTKYQKGSYKLSGRHLSQDDGFSNAPVFQDFHMSKQMDAFYVFAVLSKCASISTSLPTLDLTMSQKPPTLANDMFSLTVLSINTNLDLVLVVLLLLWQVVSWS